jgi:cell division protein FtsZ
MGIGTGSGPQRARQAALSAISSPLLDFPIQKAKGVMFNIVGGNDLQLREVDEAADIIYDAVDTDANIIFGAMIDDTKPAGEITITVIATGFPDPGYGEPFEEGEGGGAGGTGSGRKAPRTLMGRVRGAFSSLRRGREARRIGASAGRGSSSSVSSSNSSRYQQSSAGRSPLTDGSESIEK